MTRGAMDGIYILGWGSLIWDIENLAPHVTGDWRMSGGPRFPLEFSRISPKRALSLVVVIDADHGDDCPTHAIRSTRSEITAAAADLGARERAPLERIGFVAADGRSQASDPRIAARAAAWMRETGAAGAVWTDLPRNFSDYTDQPFSLSAGMAYLRGLPEDRLSAAVEYINSAPALTDTPMRRALIADPWWRAESARRGVML